MKVLTIEEQNELAQRLANEFPKGAPDHATVAQVHNFVRAFLMAKGCGIMQYNPQIGFTAEGLCAIDLRPMFEEYL